MTTFCGHFVVCSVYLRAAILISEGERIIKREDLFGYAVILAGGKSSRMGFDKQLLKKDDSHIAVSLAKKLKAIFRNVVIVTKTPELYEGMDVITCQDIYPGKGPMAGIHSAFYHTDAKSLFVIACDMVCFSEAYINYEADRMIGERTDACVTIHDDNMETFHSFYSRALMGEMEERLKADNNSLNRMLRACNITKIDVTDAARYANPAELFRNLNTPADYEKYKQDCERREKNGNEPF